MSRTVVALVAPRYDEIGGMQNYVRRVASWLRAADDEFEVVVISTKSGLRRDELVLDGVRVIRLGTLLTLSNTPVNPLWPLQLRRLFRRLGVDVVNAHSPVPFLADVAVQASGRRRSVLTYHSGSLAKGTGGVVDAVLAFYERHVLPRVFARADRVVAVSPVAAAMWPGPSALVPPGVDTTVFAPPATTVARDQSVVFVGRIEQTSRWKGLHVLLEAFARVHASRPAISLQIVGDGDAVPGMRLLAESLGVSEAVTWHGSLAPEQVAGVLRSSTVLVLPSLTDSESFGMTLIEAMATATPVIGSRVGGIPSVIRDGVDGLLVTPGEPQELADALASVLDDPSLAARLGAAGRTAAEQTWDWSHQQELTMSELRSVGATPRSGTRRRRRPRLAVVTDAVSPWNVGGKEQRQHELLTRLVHRGYDVHVHTMKWWQDEDSSRSIVRDGITFHALMPLMPLYSGERRSIRQALVFALSTLRMLFRRFDVLEVDAIPFLPLFPARVVAWLRRRPMTTTWHEYWGSEYWGEYLGASGRAAALVESTAIRLPDRIIAVSDGTAERLLQVRSRPADIHIVTPGIDGGVAELAVDEPRRGGPLQLLCAGRLLEHKRVDVALETLRVLLDRGVDARLQVIGRGPEAAALVEHARTLDLGDAVRFTEFLPEHHELLQAMAAADLVLFPTVREGFGMVALEAMAVGTPVITSDHADNFARHLVVPGVSGAICPCDPSAFADAVQSAAQHLESLSHGACATAAAYDWELIADRADAVYSSL